MTRAPAPLVLGIETSCDDTAAAVVDGAGRVLASVVSSQIASHRPYGGVVPEIASRQHLGNWPAVSRAALAAAGVELADLDLVAATRGPGLVGSLLVGLSLGKALAYGLGKPFVACHHLEGHLYSPFLRPAGPAAPVPETFVGLVVSGGHTSLYRVRGTAAATVAETRDDAMGEVFDKVGKRLGLAYPQGPRLDELAESAATDAGRFGLPVARCSDGSLDFSFSGLKSSTLGEIERLERRGELAGAAERLAAAFRRAAVDQLLDRLERLAAGDPFALLAVSGGVAANRLLRRELPRWAEGHGVELALVPMRYAGDNAAMIAHAALLRFRRGAVDDPLRAEAASRLPLDPARAKSVC